MIRLDSQDKKLQLKLGSSIATNHIPVVVCYSDKTSSQYNGGSQTSNTNNTSFVDICSSPSLDSNGNSIVRDIDSIIITNIDTADVSVFIYYNNSGVGYVINSTTIGVNETLEYTHASGWKILSSNSGSTFIASVSDTNTVALAVSGNDLTADVIYQNTSTANISEDSSGIKVDVINDSSVQKVEVTRNSGSIIGTRHQLNFIEGSNISLSISDDNPNNQIDISISAITSSGTVTSVGLSLPSIFSVTGSPVTSSGILTGTFVNQSANLVFAGPSTGIPSAPTFRSLVSADMPLISLTTGVTGVLPIANGGTNNSSFTTNRVVYFNGTSLTDSANFTFNGTVFNLGGATPSGLLIDFRQGTAQVGIGQLTGFPTLPAIYMGTSAPTATNYALSSNASGSNVVLNALTNLTLSLGATTRLSIGATSSVWSSLDVHFAGIAIRGTNTGLQIRVADQNVTSANLGVNGGRKASLGGTITDSSGAGVRALMVSDSFAANTFAAVNAVTVTQPSTIYVAGPPIAGSNITFTNTAAALWVASGLSRFDGAVEFNAGLSIAYVSKTAAYSVAPGDVIIDCTNNTFTVTLETAVGAQKRVHFIVNTGFGVITVATTGGADDKRIFNSSFIFKIRDNCSF